MCSLQRGTVYVKVRSVWPSPIRHFRPEPRWEVAKKTNAKGQTFQVDPFVDAVNALTVGIHGQGFGEQRKTVYSGPFGPPKPAVGYPANEQINQPGIGVGLAEQSIHAA